MDLVRNHVKYFLNKSLKINEIPNLKLSNISKEEDRILQLSPGGWSIDRPVAEALMNIVKENKFSRVVEIGAGFSTIIFHFTLSNERNDFKVSSIEENIDWFKIPDEISPMMDLDSFSFYTGKLQFKIGPFGIHASYKIPERKNMLEGVDLVFVDGPQYYFGREGGLDDIYKKLKIGCLIVMDDAERYTEQCVIYKWLKVYQGLELIYLNNKFGAKGLAILKVKKPLKRKFSLSAFSLGLLQGLQRVANFKTIQEKQRYLKSEKIS